MNINDPIEDLFRERSNKTVGEKPRDLVWKRIESGLLNDEKKKKPIREFVSSVWFSAAVFALIAIPYFVLFIQTINTENNTNTIEVVKNNKPIVQDKSVEINNIETEVEVSKEPIEIVKNDKLEKINATSILHDEPTISAKNDEYPQLYSAPVAAEVSILRTKVLDSIEKENQYAVAKKMNNESLRDTLMTDKLKGSAAGVRTIRGVSNLKDSSNQAKLAVKDNSSKLEELADAVPNFEEKPNEINNSETEISYKPLRFTVKTDILRTSFKRLSKTQNKIVFVNKNVYITFEKVNGKVSFTSNQPKLDVNLARLLERNKNEIFYYYQSIK